MPLSLKDDALSPLLRNCMLRSDARVDAHSQVTQELCDHVINWRRGAVDALLCKAQLSRLKIYTLRYGAEVEITPEPFGDFSLVHTSLLGGADIEVDGQRIPVAEGRTVVLAPNRKIRLHWLEGTHQLILRVPHSLLKEAAMQSPEEVLQLVPGYLLPPVLGKQWEFMLVSLLNLMALPEGSDVRAAWIDHFEKNIALFILSHQPSGDAVPTSGHDCALLTDHAVAGGGAGKLDCVLAYMHARLAAPISVEDMARVAGVSPRTLNTLCHSQYGFTPMEWLRNLRLDAVHRRLLLQPHHSVTETAMAYGFCHLGRFAQFYAQRFQEHPRDTRLRQR